MQRPDIQECTIHLAKYVHKVSFKRRSPKAIKAIKKIAEKLTGNKDVRIDSKLNNAVWHKGIRYPPTRIRVRLTRKVDEKNDATVNYTLVQYIPTTSFKGLLTETIHEDE